MSESKDIREGRPAALHNPQRGRILAIAVILLAVGTVIGYWAFHSPSSDEERAQSEDSPSVVAQGELTEQTPSLEVSISQTETAISVPVSTETPTATPSLVPPSATPMPTDTPISQSVGVITHTVVAGDILSVLARQYNTTAAEIALASDITVNSVLRLGQVLIIPVGSSSSMEEAPTSPATATPTLLPTVSTPTPAAPEVITYKVQAGDILSAIAKRFGTTSREIAAASGIGEGSTLRIGQEITIPLPSPTPGESGTASPTPTVTPLGTPASGNSAVTPTPTGSTAPMGREGDFVDYTVKANDTLSTIAQVYGVSIRAISEANNMENTDLLQIGQVLSIPLGTPTPTPTATLYPTPSPTYGPPLPAPILLKPLAGEIIGGNNTNSYLLTWSSVSILNEDEWYLVRLWKGRWPDGELVARDWTKGTSWRVPADTFTSSGSGRHDYYWSVIVARREAGAPDSGVTWLWKPLSSESEVRAFSFSR